MPSQTAETARILAAIAALPLGQVRIMEVCGTHTMSIAKAGIKSMLPENVKLLSGPGCPVCVTPAREIDAVLELAMRPDVIITSYGDMLRVPGTVRGDSLQRRRALGADVRIVYSPMDALELAKERPDKEIVFLGVGFETTAPGTAAAILSAAEEGVKNFSVFSMLKTVEPALRALMASEVLNSSIGLGWLMTTGRDNMDISQLMGIMLIILIIGIIFDKYLFGLLEDKILENRGLK